ncbi:MAG TPA: ATP-dependent helicase HrpB [Gemmatimonadaceae bacterium]|nr:ATP-dependent helicase HrpB [Gemmatimonadaceae bacterium]
MTATLDPDMPPGTAALPVMAVLSELRAALQQRNAAVLVAPPGAGKTTGVPLALLTAPWLDGARILVLEPRRLAARAAASRMAALRRERVGETIGWRMRGDTRVGAGTRIEVVTEGVLTRMLIDDPTLDGVGVICFDEFHERSIHGDTGLALALHTQALLRPDLRLLVMSATIDGARVASLLGDAPVITSSGRAFPVTTTFHPPRAQQRMEDVAVAAVREALAQHEGDVLAFLPGAREIRRAASLLDGTLEPHVDVWPLFGMLDAQAQDAAIAPSPPGRRKIVLASAIAETSLTIEGVRVVVDGGWSRVPRYAPRTGMTRLETVRVSRASADQRRGRAGRVAAGHCIRCWHEHEDAALRAHGSAEILDADLSPLALDLAGAGLERADELSWLDTPPAAAFAAARTLLTSLGALDGDGRITAHGREMSALGVHPRMAHLLLMSRTRNAVALGCDIVAVLEERDPVRAADARLLDPDLALRIDALRHGRRALPAGLLLDDGALARCRETARALRDRMGVRRSDEDGGAAHDDLGLLVAFAYPDRIGQRRDGAGARYLLRSGSGASMRDQASSLAREEWIVCAALDDTGRDATVHLAAPLTLATVREHFATQVTTTRNVVADADTGRIRATVTESLGAIVLVERTAEDVTPAERTDALRALLLSAWPDALPWTDAGAKLRQRLAFLHHHDARWPDVSDDALLATLDDWLAPALRDARTLGDLRRADLGALLLDTVDWSLRAALDRLAPTHLTVPSGSRVPVDYGDPVAPILAVRLQELFGARETPAVLDGRVPLVVHLLSPAHRPVQVTRDLPGFWRSSYADVRKDLRGRYPRHSWPEDPATATPTHRAKPRGT